MMGKSKTSGSVVLSAMVVGCATVVGAFANPAEAAEAWSVDALTCQQWIVNGTNDNVTYNYDSVGGYVTNGTSGDETGWLFCPVWLPQGTVVNKITMKTTSPYPDSISKVEVALYKHASISTGGSLTSLGNCSRDGSNTTAGLVTSCSFTSTTICNYKDGSAACDESVVGEVGTYYVLVKLTRGFNSAMRFYSVWIGNSASGSSEDGAANVAPVDCAAVQRAWEAGETLTDAEMACLPLRDERTLLSP